MEAAFSSRTRWDLSESNLSAATREARTRGQALVDLTVSNPTLCGFAYDAERLLGALTNPASMTYDPNPFGILPAREAVSNYYAGHGASVSPNSVLLTTSTSEAYSFLFRLLCDPGDELLAAQPSYPLFDFLATLDDVSLKSYPLFYDFGWWIDFAELERRITPRTKAVLLVHPNNPTGHATSPSERAGLAELCARHGLALIVDEVFLDYSLEEPIVSFAKGDHACLTFVVSGLSKIAVLPQMKVGWLAAFGPAANDAMARLEIIADTFLSMNAPAQHALPVWLADSPAMRKQVIERVRTNIKLLDEMAVSYLPVSAGWSAVLQLPQSLGSPELAETLVWEAGVIVHPGSFYALHGDHRVVVSLLGPPEVFQLGVEHLKYYCEPKKLTSEAGESSDALDNRANCNFRNSL